MWYPGHMAKASRIIERIKKDVDLVVELLDARAPAATRSYSRNPIRAKKNVIVLTKSDLALERGLIQWKEFFEKSNEHVFIFNKGCSRDAVVEFITAHVQKNGFVIIVGVPNVGKSTFINKLKGSRSAQVGAVPGITKGLQWFSVKDKFRVLDTPGLLLPDLWSTDLVAKLLLVGSLSVDMVPPKVLQRAFEIYSMAANIQNTDLESYLGEYALEKKMIIKGGQPDKKRAMVNLFNSIAQGKLGKFCFEYPQEADEDQGDRLSTT